MTSLSQVPLKGHQAAREDIWNDLEVEKQVPVKPGVLLTFNSDPAVAACSGDGGCGGDEGILFMMERMALMATQHREEGKHAGEKLLTLLLDGSDTLSLSPAQQRLFDRVLNQTVTRSEEAG